MIIIFSLFFSKSINLIFRALHYELNVSDPKYKIFYLSGLNMGPRQISSSEITFKFSILIESYILFY